MVAPTIGLLIAVIVLAISNVRMRMDNQGQNNQGVNGQQPQRDELVAPADDSSVQLSAEPDIVYPDPLPSAMTEQGINWNSDSWGSESSGESADD